jgi:hypothetical protein
MIERHKRGEAMEKGPTCMTLRANQRGSALVEQALVLTILLAVIFGIIDSGRALYTYHFVSQAAREATRWASVRGSTCVGLTGGCPAVRSECVWDGFEPCENHSHCNLADQTL